MEDKPKILIVEDQTRLRERYVRILEHPPQDWLEESGIAGFDTDATDNTEDAKEYIERARQEGRPYEAVLLDLHLPATSQDLREGKLSEDNGRELLKEIRNQYEIAVVILTGYPSSGSLVHAIRYGATDFLVKPLIFRREEQMLFVRMVKAVGVARKAIHRELVSAAFVRYAEWDSGEMKERVWELVSAICEQAVLMETMFMQRYGLDRRSDAQDPICQSLTKVRNTCGNISQKLSTEYQQKEGFQALDVESIVKEEASRVRPSYLHHGVGMDVHVEFGLRTKTAESYLRAMVAELLYGVLISNSEGDNVTLSARFSEDGKDIVVSLAAQGERIPKEVLETLKKRESLGEELRQRWRSIVLLWNLGRNIGVRIGAEYHNGRNVITLLIPVVADE